MDIDKLKSKLAADLNATQSHREASAKQAPEGAERLSDSAPQKQAPAGQPDPLPQQVEQVASASVSDDPVDRFLHPVRVWPD